ncbi:unnamed protein product [Larinioides sclopetarius]|uniref:Speckle-type POZ protein n=1 Tax=Larinioides sclopetarius TaxID=280406 RepID=A0AAV2ACS3_9ARAC
MNSGNKKFSFLWFIENYSYSPLNVDETLVSPVFTPEGSGGTSWELSLNSYRLRHSLDDSVYLKRSAFDDSQGSVKVKMEISLFTTDGSTLYSEECEHTFRMGDRRGFKPLLNMDELYVRRNTEYLPQDTLGIRCDMWKGEGVVGCARQHTARTRIGIERISFLHKVENFTTLKLYENNILQVPYHSNTKCFVSSTVHIGFDWVSEGAVTVINKHSDSSYILRRKKISLFDVSGNIIECCEIDYRFPYTPEQIQNQYQNLSMQLIFSKRNEYLPNDELSLICECTFSAGVELTKIEETLHEIPLAVYNHRYQNTLLRDGSKVARMISDLPSVPEDMNVNENNMLFETDELKAKTVSSNSNEPSPRPYTTLNQMTNNDQHKYKYNDAENLSMCPSALDDFKALYKDQLLTDVVLKTATKSFPTHRNVLCARSSVFKAMLTNDMKEKNTDCIKVEDLENETVQRLLLFLYSDSLEELLWESAIQLYYAADKYAIEKLKFLCSSYLVNNVSTSTASELLLLADTHSDTDLRKFVEDFILENEKEVFSSEEWGKLGETNPQLVISTMRLKYTIEETGK